MSRYYDPITGQISEIGIPEFNKEFVAGKTRLPDTGVITADMLAPVSSFEPVSPTEPSVFPVSGLNAQGQTELLPEEKEQSEIVKRTQSLVDQFAGKAEFQAQKETEAGISELTKTQKDLEARLNILKNEALAIPVRLQEEAKGRGITTGGLAPTQTEELRKNAIQALGVSSLLEASRGNLATAQDLVDRAVAQKYDPIEARINANLQNLELLSKDPSLTLAQKNRLEAQTARQNKLKEENDLAKKNEEEARKLALDYVGVADPITLNEMSKAKTALEVAEIAREKGLKTLAEQKIEAELAKSKADLTDQDLQFISGTENQPSGVFNKKTGIFTPSGGGGKQPINIRQDILDSNLPSLEKNNLILTDLLGNKIGQGTRTQLANILGVINASEDLAQANQAGIFTGVSPFRSLLDLRIPLPFTDASIPLPFRQSLKQKGTATTEGYLEAINLKVQQWASGAALTEAQTEQVGRFTPRVTDKDAKVREKLNNLTNFMLTQAQSQLQSEGITFSPQKVDLFESMDLLKKASPEQLEELKKQGLL